MVNNLATPGYKEFEAYEANVGLTNIEDNGHIIYRTVHAIGDDEYDIIGK